ncbi:hypothetical protein QQ045_025460 [Rhodiola kirilowii]
MTGESAMRGIAAYVARGAAQKERVRILYRRALKDTLNWAVHRHIFYQGASDLREKFEDNRHVEDPDTIDRVIDQAEATYNTFRHPDPYIVAMSNSRQPTGSASKRRRDPGPRIPLEQPARNTWKELVGKTAAEAEKKIKEEFPEAYTPVMPVGSYVTCDWRVDRVRLFVDDAGNVCQTPEIG